ncbi:MAG: roadblock/LC7 domain-containing protein [Deltaproteobacteria bacterium]|nr:roadblock/LC7 domain-containing protein [Deltaproteobacteria bacterium]
MTRTETLNKVLANLQSSAADIEAAAVVSPDGLIIAHSLPQGLEETQIAAMSAALLSMGVRTARELRRGQLEQLFVKGTEGFIVIMQAGPHAVLLTLARRDAKLGLIFLDVSRAAEEIKKTLA